MPPGVRKRAPTTSHRAIVQPAAVVEAPSRDLVQKAESVEGVDLDDDAVALWSQAMLKCQALVEPARDAAAGRPSPSPARANTVVASDAPDKSVAWPEKQRVDADNGRPGTLADDRTDSAERSSSLGRLSFSRALAWVTGRKRKAPGKGVNHTTEDKSFQSLPFVNRVKFLRALPKSAYAADPNLGFAACQELPGRDQVHHELWS